MKRIASMAAICLLMMDSTAQAPTRPEAPKTYQATAEKINDLVHTKLDARLDFSNSRLYGKAWITLRPHFYATDSLLLDAKGMDIQKVALVSGAKTKDLKYKYDGSFLDIDLDRSYRNSETYTIYIEYVAKPDELETKGSAAITDAKGLYFINPKGEDKDKPTQVWTQGETEATSVWVPTIDRPNQKTTQEILMTVPSKMVTLSNGLLVKQTPNSNGTRTDHWKMTQPHAPYLFFMGAGDFAVVKDKWKGKEVSYYVDREYASVARKIFGDTPEMMTYFSRITGVEYPWAKYAQMVGRDFVSGAMENTTATLHQESAQQDARELTDGNSWENVIAHELFHHWFGDLVTSESWSNLTLNESFANYSEYLWQEYKYGKDAADEHNLSDMTGYIMSGSEKKDLVRFHYGDKEEMFDAVSYNKGGRILHMLRNYVGDSAFFRSINLYLNTYRYKSAEAHQLRLAFEEVTGKDLNWFWNQWYFGAGHPDLNIEYSFGNNKATVIVHQKQEGDNIFQVPVNIDVYQGKDRKRYQVWLKNKVDSFSFTTSGRPELVNFDADKVLLAKKTENKSMEEYLFQYRNARNYMDRREAIDAAAKKQEDKNAANIMLEALRDKYDGLRAYAINLMDLRQNAIKTAAEKELARMAQYDTKRNVRAAAIEKLGDYRSSQYSNIFRTALKDSSYNVAGAALEAMGKIDSAAAFAEAKRLSTTEIKKKLASEAKVTMMLFGDQAEALQLITSFEKMPLSQQKFEAMQPLAEFLARTNNLSFVKRGADAILAFQAQIPEAFRDQVAPFITRLLEEIQQKQAMAGHQEAADYIGQKLPKKGF